MNGINGVNGNTGISGINGMNGINGINNVNRLNGINGSTHVGNANISMANDAHSRIEEIVRQYNRDYPNYNRPPGEDRPPLYVYALGLGHQRTSDNPLENQGPHEEDHGVDSGEDDEMGSSSHHRAL